MAAHSFHKLDSLIRELAEEKDKENSLEIAMKSANEFMRIIFPNSEVGENWASQLLEGEALLSQGIPAKNFPNHKVASWFEMHPFGGGERTAIKHFRDENAPIESKFYWLNKSSAKSRIAAGVMLTANWEDDDTTRKPAYKVGVDFFLTADANSLLVVLSNRGKLRVLELNGSLSNTQIEILQKIENAAGYDGIGEFEPQRTIHKTLWDSFALKEVNKKFYEGIATHFELLLQHLVDAGKESENAKLFANRIIGRLLFLWFLKKKEFINPSVGYFDSEAFPATEYYENLLKPLFFETLNKPADLREPINGVLDKTTPYLNGGLFEPKDNDWIDEQVSFPPDWFDSLYGHFHEFNFTTDESTPEFEQVAIDPEMLGRVFENLLASQLDETGKEARKAKGAFYTPREIVSYMCKEALREYLYSRFASAPDREGVDKLLDISDQEFEVKHSNAKRDLWGKAHADDKASEALRALEELRIIDPACGSGAFPMGMLQLLIKTHERLGSGLSSYDLKRQILGSNIFGVDIEPMAVEISRLRAWLSLIVDETNAKNARPLPNLDFKFVCANSLIPAATDELQMTIFDEVNDENIALLDKIMGRGYYEATDPAKKNQLRDEYKYAVTQIEKERGGTASERLKQRLEWNPFDQARSAGFFDYEIMFRNDEGFDIVIGNPPYIHLEQIKEQSQEYNELNYYRTYAKRGDIYTLFYERGYDMLKPGGVLCYITSNKWMRAAYGEALRDYFLTDTNPKLLIDFGGTKVFESATVDVNIILGTKDKNEGSALAVTIKDDCSNNLSDYVKQNSVNCEFQLGESWTILSEIEQSIKRKIEAVGVPLKDWDVKISRGILTGCNEAFIIDGPTKDALIAEDPKSAEIIRPILRGRDIKRYGYEFADNWLIVASYGSHEWIPAKYPAIYKHLQKFEEKLKNRGQCRYTSSGRANTDPDAPFPGQHHWLELDNNPRQDYLDDFSKPKIIWKVIGSSLAFAIDSDEYLINNACYLMTGDRLEDILPFLNSKLINWYSDKTNMNPTGVGDAQVGLQNIRLFPVPMKKLMNQQNEACLNVEEVEKAVCEAYGLNSNEVEHLFSEYPV